MLDDKPDPSLLYDVAKRQLDVQLGFIDAVDTKIGILFAGGSAEVAVAAALLALKPEVLRSVGGLVLLGVIAYLTLTAASITGLWSRDWHVGPSITGLADLYIRGLDDNGVKRQATWKLVDEWKANLVRLRFKTRALHIALVALTVETTPALLALVGLVFSGKPPS